MIGDFLQVISWHIDHTSIQWSGWDSPKVRLHHSTSCNSARGPPYNFAAILQPFYQERSAEAQLGFFIHPWSFLRQSIKIKTRSKIYGIIKYIYIYINIHIYIYPIKGEFLLNPRSIRRVHQKDQRLQTKTSRLLGERPLRRRRSWPRPPSPSVAPLMTPFCSVLAEWE